MGLSVEYDCSESGTNWFSQFKMLDVDYDISCPQLVLATDVKNPYYVNDEEFQKYYDYDFNTSKNKEFLKIEHEYASEMLNTIFMWINILSPKENIKESINEINEKWKKSKIIVPSLSEVIEYNNFLKEKLDVNCEKSYSYFAQGLYPIDATIENISKLCDDDLPEDLDDLIFWKNGIQKLFAIKNRWTLFIVGENS